MSFPKVVYFVRQAVGLKDDTKRELEGAMNIVATNVAWRNFLMANKNALPVWKGYDKFAFMTSIEQVLQ